MAGMSGGGFEVDTNIVQGSQPGSHNVYVTDPFGRVSTAVARGGLGGPGIQNKLAGEQATTKQLNLQTKAMQAQLEMQNKLFEKLLGGGGIFDQFMGGFSGGASQPGFPDPGIGGNPAFNIPGMGGVGPGMPITPHGGAGQPGFREDAPGMSQPGFPESPPTFPGDVPITAHGSGIPISQHAAPTMGGTTYGQGRRNQLATDFDNLAKSAQTMLVQRGFGGSSLVPDTFAEIGEQKTLSMNELNDQLFREQLQFRASERAPMFSILQSLMGGIGGIFG